MLFTINDLLDKVIEVKGSDLHILVDSPPIVRVEGVLYPVKGTEPLKPDETAKLVYDLLNEEQRKAFEEKKELDFSFSYKDVGRFRGNAFYQKGNISLALRLIPYQIPAFDSLNLPPHILELTKLSQGLILVTGPTGQGKSTTIASIIDHINEKQKKHIITIEDPIEYLFVNKQSIIQQREMYQDTLSWPTALRSVLREDPNIVFVGEMRDFETVAAALTVAETGHLVFATLHTNSASQTIDRIIDVFPDNQQAQVKIQLASVLESVISQRLVIGKDGTRYPAVEILLTSPAVRNTVREGKTFQLDNIIATSADVGMISLERSLAMLVDKELISFEEAKTYTTKPSELARLMKS